MLLTTSKTALISLGLLLAANANAADFSYVGNFVNDNDVQTFSFTVNVESLVTLRTWSYAGGVNSAGDTITRGGFDPILALFDTNTGSLIAQNDDGEQLVNADINNAHYDTYLSSLLGVGTYTVSIQQFDNFATGPFLSNGFKADGVQNISFRDHFESGTRDSHWAFDILNVNTAIVEPPVVVAVPEPETYAMLLGGLGLIGFAARIRKSA